ncbi:MAG: 4'-phosphopantetheinyl transferase superfamily protein [Gammaproteobacteria bacterium]|nr:4'-phosphopantetheinyl transferase superfamily protein [Gammaproteobacteria bacterium]MDH5801201.1 4'-phosphopantetheinyl transferase superfamily protein [Gammaproteobacteria bacterium]
MVKLLRLKHFPPPLLENAIHVFTTQITDLAQEPRLSQYLNETEQQRAARFLNPEHGRRFSQVRGLLRMWLGTYLQQSPQSVQFNYNRYGQPSVSDKDRQTPLYFNISHSGDMAAFIFGTVRVGIDVEQHKPMKNLNGMSRYISHPKELAEFEQLDEEAAYTAFFRLWTRKEAYIKANGQGLSMGLRSIYIGTQREPESRVEYKDRIQSNWLIKDLAIPSTNGLPYQLAVAIEHNI